MTAGDQSIRVCEASVGLVGRWLRCDPALPYDAHTVSNGSPFDQMGWPSNSLTTTHQHKAQAQDKQGRDEMAKRRQSQQPAAKRPPSATGSAAASHQAAATQQQQTWPPYLALIDGPEAAEGGVERALRALEALTDEPEAFVAAPPELALVSEHRDHPSSTHLSDGYGLHSGCIE